MSHEEMTHENGETRRDDLPGSRRNVVAGLKTSDILQLITVMQSLAQLACVLVVLVFIVLRKDLLLQLVSSVRHVEVFGVKLDVEKAASENAAEVASTSLVPVSTSQALPSVRRAFAAASRYKDAIILWVDDHPENNLAIRRLLAQLGARVFVAVSTDEAASIEQRNLIDVMITDIERGPDKGALGLGTKSAGMGIGVIFYISEVDPSLPKPEGSFGITNRPDELINYITDLLERRSFSMAGRSDV